LHLKLIDQGADGAISEMWSTKSVMFRFVDGDYDLSFHNTSQRQFAVLTGSVNIEVGNGTIKRLGSGSVLLAEDITGRGHRSSSIAGEPRTWLHSTGAQSVTYYF
jgi:hypothetical protein